MSYHKGVADKTGNIGTDPWLWHDNGDGTYSPTFYGGAGGGGGTEYTEDAPAAANPVGAAIISRRRDALSATEVSADGDNIGLVSTAKGELYVKHVDAIPVTGTFWQATQPVSGPVTDAQIRATPLPVSGTVTAQDGGGSLTVDGTVTSNQGAAGTAWEIIGDVAGDQPVPTNPVSVGGRASSALPSAVSADGDSVNNWLLRNGAQVVAYLPHLPLMGSPYTLTSKTVQVTTTQTGSDVWSPASGKTLVITKMQIQAGGTTAATVQVWFGANADTTYTRGTDLALFDGEFAPSATLKPGVVDTGPWIASTADHEVHLTTSAGITLTVTLWGYEV